MRANIKVGIFFVVALLILLAVFELVGEIPFITKEQSYKAYFKSVGEIREGNPVKMQGVQVGKISKIQIVDGKIEVTMKVEKGAPVKQDSLVTIKLTSPLGISYANLTFGSPDSPPAAPGSVLPSEDPADINDILVKVESAISSIESTFAAFGENKDRVTNILDGLDSVLGGVGRGEGTLGKLVKDDTLYEDARQTISSLNDVAVSIKHGKGTLGKLVNDDSLYVETKKTMTNLGELAGRLTNAEGSFGKLLNDDTLYDETAEAAANLNKILKKVEKGEGTLGKLVSDDSLYFDAKNTLKKVEKGIDTQEDLAPLSTLGAAFGILTIF